MIYSPSSPTSISFDIEKIIYREINYVQILFASALLLRGKYDE